MRYLNRSGSSLFQKSFAAVSIIFPTLHDRLWDMMSIWLSTRIKGKTSEKFCKEQGWKYEMITKGSLAFYGKIN